MSLWDVFQDIGIMSLLLVFGQLCRAKIKLFQKLLIPPALLAGFLGLLLGPNGFGLLPFSGGLATYAAVLIVVIFAAMPIGDSPTKEQLSGPTLGGMFLNITGIAVLQYAVGMLVTVYLLQYLFQDLHPGFGLMMATGFYGGHGTAAAVGSAFSNMGWPDAAGLAMTTATVGIVGGILFGVVIINWGTRKGYTHYVESPKDLPQELRTGLIPEEKQKPGGKVTISSISLDPLAFHLGIIMIASLAGYLTANWIKSLWPAVEIPAFCIALVYGFLMQFLLKKTNTLRYVDRGTINRISGTSTDFLIISGVASVNISLVIQYAIPLLIVCVLGFLATWFWFIVIGSRCSREDWFERNMISFGHATGVVATGVLLLRIVDPDLRSRGLEDTGIADIFNRPIIVGLQVIPPILLGMGLVYSHIVTWGIVALFLIMMVVAYALKWWTPKIPLKVYHEKDKAA